MSIKLAYATKKKLKGVVLHLTWSQKDGKTLRK